MIRKAVQILRHDGAAVLAQRAHRHALRKLSRGQELELPVAVADVLQAQAADAVPRIEVTRGRRPTGSRLTVNWVIAPIAKGAGGHHTILRFARALEARGHRCRLIVYDGRGIQTAQEARVILRRHFPPMRAEVCGLDQIPDCDALFATAWQTAYPVFNAETSATKFYFVQDYEPFFHPVGALSTLAENTYRFGLHGITAGRWLSRKLATEHGMSCEHFEFGSDPDRYRLDHRGPRAKVVFYARPGAPRRGFELGVLALAIFAQRNPSYEINLLGADLSNWTLPFRFVRHGVLSPARLNELYNQAAAALVISLTNMSLLPLELLSAGCIPVVNDGENNRLVTDNPHIAYTDATPHALARALEELVTRVDLPAYAAQAAQSVSTLSWADAESRFERILAERLLHGSGHPHPPSKLASLP